MDDLLKQFLSDGESLMENVPLDFFDNYSSGNGGEPNGIHIVWFIEWAREKGLLASSFNDAINDYSRAPDHSAKSFRDFCADYTQGALKPEHFSERAKAFVRSYYTTGWDHRYLEDLEIQFPDVDYFDQLVDKSENCEAVNTIISRRFSEFES